MEEHLRKKHLMTILKENIFRSFCKKYYENGLPVIPLIGKRPFFKGWQGYCENMPTENEISEWESKFYNYNIGLPCGPAAGIIAIDIDTDDPKLRTLIDSILPPSPVRKKGKKGETRFFKYNGQKNRKVSLHPKSPPLVELLSKGNQTVLPASIHPETGKPYQWLTPETLENYKSKDLPDLPLDIIDKLQSQLSGQKIESSQMGTSGRNLALKSQVAAAISKGKPDEVIISEVINFDRKNHRPPLFSDPTEAQMRNHTPEQNAVRFVGSIRRSIEHATPHSSFKSQGPSHDPNYGHRLKWPKPLEPEAYHGLAGRIVQTLEPHTEADSAALLVQFLAAYGNAVGRNSYYPVEADRHYLNIFVVLVGDSSRGRKGTSWGYIRNLFALVDPDWKNNCIKSGLSSGEGLIWAVHDPIEKYDTNKEGALEARIIDPGVEDKRLFVLETEFAAVLKSLERDGNKLSAIIRDAWDGGTLRSLTKNVSAKATGAHISIVGHISKNELIRQLRENETANGFGNRFLWISVKRSKLLPFGGCLSESHLSGLAEALRPAVEYGKREHRLMFDQEAVVLWESLYKKLGCELPGLLGNMTTRSEPQILRLSSIYALLDQSEFIRSQHLLAATAVWDYCMDSCRFIFGEKTGDKFADRLLDRLADYPEGLTLTEIQGQIFQRNTPASKIHSALEQLQAFNLIHSFTELGIKRWVVGLEPVRITNCTISTTQGYEQTKLNSGSSYNSFNS